MTTREGEFVRILDKIMPLIVNIRSQQVYSSYKIERVNETDCYNYIKEFSKRNKFTDELFEYLFQIVKDRKIFFEK